MIKIKEEGNLKFEYLCNHEEEVSPVLELFRGKIYTHILKGFIFICINKLGPDIFNIKKSYPRTLTNLLSSWFFTLYSTYDFKNDYFFPSNFDNMDSLKGTLKDFSKYNANLENVDEKINDICNYLKSIYKSSLDNLNDYKSSQYYNNVKSNFKVSKSEISQKRNNDEVLFYKFNIEVPFVIKDKRQLNVIDNILIPKYIYQKLENIYNGPKNKIDTYVWAIVYRYQLLGSNNNQLGVLPDILKKMNNDLGLNFECFASAINFTFHNYCSVYFDLEKYFGSKGNFFDMKALEGTYSFNPPYQKNVMDSGINRLLYLLDNAKSNNKNLTFIITIPIWDKIGKKIMKFTHPEKKTVPDIDYEEFDSIEKILNSKYFKLKLMIPKNKFTYLDHNFHLYKNVTIQHTYILVISTENKNFQSILGKYNFYDSEQEIVV